MEVFKNGLEAMRQSYYDNDTPRQRGQVSKRQTRYDYRAGPMKFLGQQIVKAMEDAGFPAFIHCHYRGPAQQDEAYALGTSQAKAGQSPHQYMEAVDIVHPSKYWQVSSDYWDALAACVRVVEERYDINLVDGGTDWGWDNAHIQTHDWKNFRKECEGKFPPSQSLLDRRFDEVLPKVWSRYIRDLRDDHPLVREWPQYRSKKKPISWLRRLFRFPR